jgi:uncharacterized protein YeeX (DUF496 family)
MYNFLVETVSPLSQFEIREILSIEAKLLDSSIRINLLSNIGLYLTISMIFILMIILSINLNKILSNK